MESATIFTPPSTGLSPLFASLAVHFHIGCYAVLFYMGIWVKGQYALQVITNSEDLFIG